jgi:hypothetical protein
MGLAGRREVTGCNRPTNVCVFFLVDIVADLPGEPDVRGPGILCIMVDMVQYSTTYWSAESRSVSGAPGFADGGCQGYSIQG